MLDHDELRKYFTKTQRQDIIELDEICKRTPPGRVRRARLRKPKPGYIPRPVNSFMSYRTEKQSIIRKFCPTANHREISKIVAKWWHNADHDEKAIFISKAAAAKNAHAEKYPDYIFRPKARKSKKATTTHAAINHAAINHAATTTQAASAATDGLDTINIKKEDSCKPYCSYEMPFQTTIMQDNGPSFLYQDDILFGDNNEIWSNTQRDYAYACNQFPDLPTTSSQYHSLSVPQPSSQINQSISNFEFTLDNKFFYPVLPTINTMPNIISNADHQYRHSNASDLINSTSYASLPNCELKHVNPTRICLSNATPSSQTWETPLLDYLESPVVQQHVDSSLLTAQNTPAIQDTPVIPNTPFFQAVREDSFQIDSFYKLFSDPVNDNSNAGISSSDTESIPFQNNTLENMISLGYGSDNSHLLFNNGGTWKGVTE